MLFVSKNGNLMTMPIVQRGELLFSPKFDEMAIKKSISMDFCRSEIRKDRHRLACYLSEGSS